MRLLGPEAQTKKLNKETGVEVGGQLCRSQRDFNSFDGKVSTLFWVVRDAR